MELSVIYLIIYIMECFIFWQYAEKLFTSGYTNRRKGLCFFAGYFILFLISFAGNFPLNVIAFSFVIFLFEKHIRTNMDMD